MSTPTIILWSCLILATIIYLQFWHKVANYFLTETPHAAKIPNNTLEIIIVFRNEAAHLPALLDTVSTILQAIPINIQLINDHSSDEGLSLIQQHTIYTHPQFLVTTPPSHIHSKKQALNWGIQQSSAEHIYVSDADCIINVDNVEALWYLHTKHHASLTLGLVAFQAKPSIIQQYQLIENTGLIALSVFHAHQQQPSMANAANMLLKRSDFLETNPYKENLDTPGGDDIFLIQALQKSGKKIVYANNIKAFVSTSVLGNWRALWQQRIRWAKKSTKQAYSKTQKSQILFVLYYALFWGISLFSWSKGIYVLPAFIWLFKWIGEYVFIRKIFLKLSNYSPSFYFCMVSSTLQSAFIPLVALGQFFSKVHWKDRTYS